MFGKLINFIRLLKVLTILAFFSLFNGKPFKPSFSKYIMEFIQLLCKSLSPKDSLKFLLCLEREIYLFTGNEACRYGNGIHTKHRHTGYHNFFIKNIKAGDRVLDIGCGNGSLAYDIVKSKNDVFLFGIDINEENIEYAQQNFKHNNLKFIHGDALKDLPNENYNIVILSNVLEHIKDRINFLKTLKKNISPEKILIRVPMYERDWRVPLMDEIGIDSRLDNTHFIEYRYEDFIDELTSADIEIISMETRWGEFWSVCK